MAAILERERDDWVEVSGGFLAPYTVGGETYFQMKHGTEELARLALLSALGHNVPNQAFEEQVGIIAAHRKTLT